MSKLVRDMDIGEGGYITPWSVSYDERGYPAVDLNAMVSDEPRGMTCVYVERWTEFTFLVSTNAREWHKSHPKDAARVGYDAEARFVEL